MTKTEINLVMKAQMGDEIAFNGLFKTFYNQAYYIALRISNCDADAKDAVQETFIQVKRSLKDLQEPKNFRKWMAQIVLSKCNKIFRKNKYTIMDPTLLNALPYEEHREYMEGHRHNEKQTRKDIVLELMGKLTYHQRTVLFLAYFEQMSIKEIAAALEIPEGTVKSRMTGAKVALKKYVQDFENKNDVRMHVAFTPALLLLAARMDYKAFTGMRPKMSFSSIASTQPIMISIAAVSVVGITAVGGMSLSNSSNKVKEILPQNTNSAYLEINNQKYSQRELFFKLREWAHCHVEIEAKSADDYKQIQPYYDFLKLQAGPYYERLKGTGWVTSYEEHIK